MGRHGAGTEPRALCKQTSTLPLSYIAMTFNSYLLFSQLVLKKTNNTDMSSHWRAPDPSKTVSVV